MKPVRSLTHITALVAMAIGLYACTTDPDLLGAPTLTAMHRLP